MVWPLKDLEEETFLSRAVTWKDHPDSDLDIALKEWKPEGRKTVAAGIMQAVWGTLELQLV